MSDAPTVLPPPFQDLEAYADWALATESERTAKRVSSPMEDVQAFYDTMLARLNRPGTVPGRIAGLLSHLQFLATSR